MGTRCNLQFVGNGDKFQLYEHWDGYPSWKLTKIMDFIKWNKFRNNDFSYSVANYIFFSKSYDEINRADNKSKSVTFKVDLRAKEESNFHRGMGVVPVMDPNDKNFDSLFIEWFYRIDFDKRIVTVIKPNYKWDDKTKTSSWDKPEIVSEFGFDDEVMVNDDQEIRVIKVVKRGAN